MLIFYSSSNDSIHITSVVALATLLNSDLVLDLDIFDCFLEHHDTGFCPKYIHDPLIDHRSFESLLNQHLQNQFNFD